MDKPVFSAIVVSYNSSGTIGACLNSLRSQDFGLPFEVIVVDSSTDGTARLVAEEFPDVTLVSCPTRKSPGAARNLGMAKASSDIICFLDSDCVAAPNWLSKLWEAHSRPDPVIGGSVGNAATRSMIGWASYFTEFTRWMPGLSRQRLPDIPTCNLSFKRWILEALGPFGEFGYCEDSAYNWRLRRAGYPEPYFEPEIAVAHDGITDLRRFLAHEVFHGQSYGRVRVTLEGFGLLRRLGFILAVPLIHLLLCCRVTSRVLRSRRFLHEFTRAFPLVSLGLLAWSVGEGIGYLRGANPAAGSKGGSRTAPTRV